MKNIRMLLITAGLMLGLSTSASVQAHVKGTSRSALTRTRTSGSRSITRPFNDGLILDLKGGPARKNTSVSMRSSSVDLPIRGFKSMSGMDSETEVIARPGPRNR